MSVMLRNLEWVDPRRRSAASTSVYAATRSAVETMTAILAKELRGRNITVNVVAPGPVATDMFPDGQIAGAGRSHGQDESDGVPGYA